MHSLYEMSNNKKLLKINANGTIQLEAAFERVLTIFI